MARSSAHESVIQRAARVLASERLRWTKPGQNVVRTTVTGVRAARDGRLLPARTQWSPSRIAVVLVGQFG